MIAQPSHQRLLFVNKQYQNCANIDAAMNCSEYTSWGKGFIAFLLVNKLLIIFTVSFDVFDRQSSTTGSFGRFIPAVYPHPRELQVNWLAFPQTLTNKNIHNFRAVSGNPNKMHMEILLLVGCNWI